VSFRSHPLDDTAESESHADRRERFRSVLSMIHHNTGDPQKPVVTAPGLWTSLDHSNLDKGRAIKSLQAAREHDHVFRWRDADGKWCYGLNSSAYDQELRHYDEHGFGPEDKDALRDMIETELSRPDHDEDLVIWCNTRLQEIRDQEDENDE